jgi:hypothetical protein
MEKHAEKPSRKMDEPETEDEGDDIDEEPVIVDTDGDDDGDDW